MSCTVKINRHGFLALQLFWRGLRSWEGTGAKDTPKNRSLWEARARIISEEIETGKFDYLKHFPNGNKADQFRPAAPVVVPMLTIGGYYVEWIERKKPPVVRAGLERDYKEQFKRDILPRFRTTALVDLSPEKLHAFREYLLHERGLSIKSCRNIIDGTFRAMMRDWRADEAFKPTGAQLHPDAFAFLKWPRRQNKRPDPFTEEERDEIVAQFAKKSPFYVPFIHALFWTGARPSELLGLRWGDIDLRAGFLSISKSRYLDEDGATKTLGSDRVLRLLPSVVNMLKPLKPLKATEKSFVFLNQEGRPVNFRTWRKGVWYRILRGLEIRPRKPYCTRHTFISIGLSNNANIKWLAEYCGTSVAMIEKHYGKYIRNDADEQLSRILGAKSETLSETLEGDKRKERERFGEKSSGGAALAEEEVGGPTWTRTLPFHKLTHLRKSPEVAGEIEECFNSPLLYLLP